MARDWNPKAGLPPAHFNGNYLMRVSKVECHHFPNDLRMSPVLDHFKGSSVRMPGTFLDNANGGSVGHRSSASLRGGARRPRSGAPRTRSAAYPFSKI